MQWDPERALNMAKLERRAIQIGIRGRTVHQYVDEWIIGLEDVTDLAHAVQRRVKAKKPLNDLPIAEERVYPVDAEIAKIINIRDM